MEFAKAARSHWDIENSLHWVMDIVFRDDEGDVRISNASANFITHKHITLNMLNDASKAHYGETQKYQLERRVSNVCLAIAIPGMAFI